MPISRRYSFTPKGAGYTIWVTRQTEPKKRPARKGKSLVDMLIDAAFRKAKANARRRARTRR